MSGTGASGSMRSGAPLEDITFVILTFNEDRRLPACLDSLGGLDAKIFAVDSFSTDGTVGLFVRGGIKYVQHPFINYGDQRRWAQKENPFKTRWVFHLDADERISNELRNWLQQDFPRLSGLHDGFFFSRRTVFMGRWIRWGGHYPAYHLRLFRADRGHCEDKAYDQHFVVSGKVHTVKHADIIDTVTSDIASFVRSHERWASLEAEEAISGLRTGEVQSSLGGSPIEKKRWLKSNIYQRAPLFLRSFIYFVYRYVFRFGFLDGKEGLIFHVLQGFWFRFLVDAKILELRRKISNNHSHSGKESN